MVNETVKKAFGLVGVVVMFLVLTAVALSFVISPVYAATATLNNPYWDCVDSGKHLDWDGKTNYMPQFESAVNTWNGYKSGIIRKDTVWIIEDVKISDYYEVSSVAASSSSNGKIKFNQYNMDVNTNAQNQKICTAMLGSALGLGATSVSSDVMYTYSNSVTSLSANDKASYDAAYKKY